MSTTSLPIFVTGVSFPRKKPGDVERAWLELEDDADCHPLKIAVPVDFAQEVAKHFPSCSSTEDGEGDVAKVTIVFPADRDEIEDERLPSMLRASSAPSVEAPPVTSAHVQKLVKLRRAYEEDPPFEEHYVGAKVANRDERTRGIVAGIQLAIDSLCHDLGIKVDDQEDPSPSRKKKTRKSAKARVDAHDVDDDDDYETHGADEPLGALSLALLTAAVARTRENSTTSKDLLCVLAGYAPSGNVNAALADLRDRGLLEGEGSAIEATSLGSSVVGFATLRSASDLVALWLSKLGTLEGALLNASLTIARRSVTVRTPIQLHDLLKEARYNKSGNTNAAMAKLKRLGLIERDTLRPIPELLR